ncbi:hypothetical protein SO802_012498 [Lithocarpus litseifolius]|uniref:RNase H type-1 domain-containing protein n=1 Tax=Lithocarpus litseifolius TaxID=425828 RepID=A0AAW2D531_9ROSI
MVFIEVELSPKHKRHKLQGASVMDTKKSRQPGAICDDNVGDMASAKPGVVIRDHTGSIIASLAQLISPALQPAEIEVIAAARAPEFGNEIGISEAVLEGNSELITESLKAGGNTIASAEPLI